MADARLQVDGRTVSGKKVKSLRRQGIVPAHLYGRETDSLSLQAPLSAVTTLLRAVERNQIIDLQINGESQPRPVVLRGVQRDPVSDQLLHIDFFQISLTQRMHADVSLNFVGEAPAVQVYGGILLHQLEHVTVEALPADIPGRIDVDVSSLTELEASLHVRDLNVPPNVLLLTDPDMAIVKVAAPRVAEVEEAAPEEAAAAAGEEGAPAPETAETPSEPTSE
jgi:large subunit ribosomal protein L25